jgi:excisionase family DNA binding protein
MAERFISPTRAAAELAVTPRTVRDLLKSGTIPGARIGGQYRVDRAGLESWLERQMAELRPDESAG